MIANVFMLSGQYYNESVRVDSIHNYNQNNEDTIYIANLLSSIQDSDIVLLHQAKGIKWNYASGTIASDYGFAGRFELLIVLKRSGQSVIVRNVTRNESESYVPKGLQLVRVGRFTDIRTTKIISSPIQAEPWDGEKGGILCIIADTLKLLANISASGCGYKGGQPVNSSTVVCRQSDSVTLDQKNFPLSKIQWAGLKGESVVDADTSYIRGNAPQYSGGGGGNGYHSGGGGGGNFYPGGLGGYEALICGASPDTIGGRGGKGMGSGLLNGFGPIVTFGGGGGCSTQKNGFTATKGGNGGGIIIIMANVLVGNNYIIASNGQSVTDTATAGAGGGGAGGTIVLDVNEYLTKVRVQLRGGNGGSVVTTPPIPGMGGGGAGGYLRFNGNNKSDNITLDITPGNPGNILPPINKNAGAGIIGFAKGNFVMPVKDFLFNLMPANQEICEGDTPNFIKASVPKGSTNVFKYEWWQSADKVSWTKIDTATRRVYQPPALFSTTYYRRIVHAVDTGNNILVSDTSFIYTIKVWPKITSNTIHTDTFAVCKGIPMPQVNGSLPAGGNGSFSYLWQDSSRTSPTWKPAIGINNGVNYQPTYTDTIYLRRYVTSRVCKSISNRVGIMVLPPLQNTFITDTQWVSLGNTFAPLQAQNATGGDGSYTYIWQKSSNGVTWLTIDSSSNNNIQIIAPPTLPDTQYFRRIVYSGLFNTCKDTTKALPLYALDSIHNNLISGSDTICARTEPVPFTATVPFGGDNSFRFLWQQSNDGLIWDTLSASNSTSLSPGIVYQNTFYRRIVFSGRNDACVDTSNVIQIVTKPAIENNFIQHSKDTTICYGQTPGTLMGSVPVQGDGPYQYQWETKTADSFVPAPGIFDSIHYNAPFLFENTYVRRKVMSGICTSYSDTVLVRVLPLITNNFIAGDTTVCKHTAPHPLQGTTPSGGDPFDYRYQWQSSTQNSWETPAGVINQKNYQPSGLDSVTRFRRIVFSGPYNTCIDTSNTVTVGIHQLPSALLTPFNDSLCLGQFYQLKIQVNGTTPFIVKYTDQNAVYDSLINNTGLFGWTIYPYAPGQFQYSLAQVVDGHGCSPDSMPGKGLLQVFEVPVAFAGSDTEVCGQEVMLRANKGIGIGTWSSSIAATFDSGIHAPETKVISSQFGTHAFTWTLNNGGCIDSSTIYVTFDQPPPDPLVGEDQQGPFLFKTRLKAYLPMLGTGRWTTPDTTIKISDVYDPEATVENLKFGKNYFQWYVENGVCRSASDTLIVTVNDIRIPEGFSPNGDGINDTLVIKGLEQVSNAELIVLNRWGIEVYHSKDYKNNWDGKYKGNVLPLDTYYLILNVIGRTYKGFLVIRK
ncbi:MAG: gliding motility-associated C-terminal domain-containing protein [Bacteroidales bacterium]